MIQLIESNWFAFSLVAALAVLVALWLLLRARKPKERSYRPDVLDEGVAPAARNQALIDAPRAGDVPPVSSAPEGLAGAGVAVAAAAEASEREHEARAGEPPAEPASETDDAVFASNEPDVAFGSSVAAAAKIDDAAEAVDDLSRIKGLGPKIVAMLGDMGISRYDQIAAWSDEDVQRIDAQMGRFAGRIDRDDWRTQAKYLASGDTAGYEDKFGKL